MGTHAWALCDSARIPLPTTVATWSFASRRRRKIFAAQTGSHTRMHDFCNRAQDRFPLGYSHSYDAPQFAPVPPGPRQLPTHRPRNSPRHRQVQRNDSLHGSIQRQSASTPASDNHHSAANSELQKKNIRGQVNTMYYVLVLSRDPRSGTLRTCMFASRPETPQRCIIHYTYAPRIHFIMYCTPWNHLFRALDPFPLGA